MSIPLRVRFDGLTDTRRQEMTSALATLPDSLRRDADSGDKADDIVIIDGSPGWPARAADSAARGSRGVLVLDPDPPRFDELTALDGLSIPLAIATPWLHHSAIHRITPEFRRLAGRDVLLEARATVTTAGDFDRHETALLTTVSHLVDEVFAATSRAVRTGTRAVQARGARGTLLTATVVDGPASRGSAEFTITRGSEGARLDLPPASWARPAIASVIRADSRVAFKTPFESAHRASLRRLRDAVRDRATLDDLSRYRAALATLQLPTPRPRYGDAR